MMHHHHHLVVAFLLLLLVMIHVDLVSVLGTVNVNVMGGFACDDISPITSSPTPTPTPNPSPSHRPISSSPTPTPTPNPSPSQRPIIPSESQCCNHCHKGVPPLQPPTRRPSSSSSPSLDGWFGIYCFVVFGGLACIFATPIVQPVIKSMIRSHSVLVLQVAFDGETHQIQKRLESVSNIANSRVQGRLYSMLSETAACMGAYPNNCSSAYSHSHSFSIKGWLMSDWEKYFNLEYRELRKKVIASTRIKINQRNETRQAGATDPRYVIVTVLVAAVGRYNFPDIEIYSDVVEDLSTLTSIKSIDIKAARVLWASCDDLDDFPSLRRLCR